jgi:hypothetical protein
MSLIKTQEGGYFPAYIKRRISLNKNFICCVSGGTGSGKSYSSLKLAELLDPNFDIRNVCFTPKEFVDLIDGQIKPLKKGAVLVWDEMQVSMSNLDYQGMQSKLINYILQTFRYQNFCLIVTTPHFSFINSQSRKLFHCRMETLSINKNTKTCKLKPLLLQTNQKKGDIYEKYLRVKIPGKNIIPLTRINVVLASAELIKAYENKKDEFNKRLRSQVREELEILEDGDRKKPLTEKQKEILDLLKEGHLIPDICDKLNIHHTVIYRQLKYIKKKGIVIKPQKEKTRVIRYNIEGYA